MLVTLLLSAVGIYGFFSAYLYLNQRSFIYIPVAYEPGDLEQLAINSPDATTYATVLNPGNPQAIIYFGGNAEIVDYSADMFSLVFPKHTVYLAKYRGYGHSQGRPTEPGIYADALAVFDAVKPQHQTISIIGRSLGAAVATWVATHRDIDRLILVAPFDSVLAIARSMYPLFPVKLLLKDKHDSLSRAGRISVDTLVIAGEQDRIIPRKHTDALVQGFTGANIHYEVFPDMGHNGWSQNSDYYRVLGEFMN